MQRQIDKVGDLLDASLNCQSTRAANLRETASILRAEMRGFHDRLEELRERLEDTSRCFDLLARCRQGQQDNGDLLAELVRLTTKSGNEKLVEKCQVSVSNLDFFLYNSIKSTYDVIYERNPKKIFLSKIKNLF